MTAPTTAAGTPRRRRRCLVFVIVGLLFVGIGLELGGFVAWWVLTGSPFGWAAASIRREEAREGDVATTSDRDEQVTAAQNAVTRSRALHPYLGYVIDHMADRDTLFPVSSYGLVDDAPPLHKRSPDRYIVGVLGGSLALQHCLYAEKQLIAALQRSPELAERDIEIVRLALGGYHQPQQLIMLRLLLLLGGEFDCIINIDGFNEVALAENNVDLGIPAWFPRGWARLMDTFPTAEQQLRLGLIALRQQQRIEHADFAANLWWSPLAQFLWLWRDNGLVDELGTLRIEAARAAAAPSLAITGPGTDGQTVEQARTAMIALWRRASIAIHELCASRGIRYFHFLQPNQYVPGSKPIGAAEAARAIDLDNHYANAVRQAYPMLQREGKTLRAAGVEFTDLTMIFEGHTEPIYVDKCCHFDQHGHAIMAEYIAAAVRRQLDLEGVTITRLEVQPERIVLDSPLENGRVEVIGIDKQARRHDISGAALDVEMHAEPANRIAIEANGTLRARRRGQATLHVTLDSAAAEVAIDADWPDLFEASDGVAPPNGKAPRILLDPERIAAGDTELSVRCVDLPKANGHLLVVAPDPLPATSVGSGLHGMETLLLAANGGTATTRLQVGKPHGHPIFLRIYAVGEHKFDIISASPTVVITRDH